MENLEPPMTLRPNPKSKTKTKTNENDEEEDVNYPSKFMGKFSKQFNFQVFQVSSSKFFCYTKNVVDNSYTREVIICT